MRRRIALTVGVAIAFLTGGLAQTAWDGSASSAVADDATLGHKKTAWKRGGGSAALNRFASDYMKFLGAFKTEREVVGESLRLARARGHRDLFAKTRPAVKPGARLYADVDGKQAAFIVVGSEPLANGVHVVATHVDAVRIDIKQNPVYSDANMALLQTHYYGGIKKYQWLSIPLELRGVVTTLEGKNIEVKIGDSPGEPVLVIPDVAVHVARRVDGKEGEELPGESLDPVVSSTPRGSGADRFSRAAAALIQSQLGVSVSDLTSAELQLVPAAMPREVGLDRALIGGYGQDDRSCSYAALRAIFDVSKPKHTSIVILTDREEIGSHGNTGARSAFMRRLTAELLEGTGVSSTEAAVNRTLANSIVFSADVAGGVNPLYPDLYEKGNANFIGSGLTWNQSAVHAELMAYVRRLFRRAKVINQAGNWTKSTGGAAGGTILEFFTRHGMRGLNVSIPLLSMHSPYELISKADLYEAYRGYTAFLND